jgi:hypothetical protein
VEVYYSELWKTHVIVGYKIGKAGEDMVIRCAESTEYNHAPTKEEIHGYLLAWGDCNFVMVEKRYRKKEQTTCKPIELGEVLTAMIKTVGEVQQDLKQHDGKF